MNRFASYRVWAAVAILLSSATAAWAAVYGGTIESVSTEKIVLKFRTSNKTQTFRVSSGTRVALNNKPSSLSQLKAGMTVSMTTASSGRVLAVQARRAQAARTAQPSKPSRPEPKPAASNRPSRGGTVGKGPSAGSWPQYRGPNRDNISLETGLLKNWPSAGPPLLWTARGLGEAYSTVAVADGKIFTMGSQANNQTAFALDLDTGQQVWATPCGPRFGQGRGNGPRSTPTVDGDYVYVVGGAGELSCLEAQTGRVKWQKNILREFNASNISWGISESVLIDGEKLICTPGGRGAMMVALNKQNGREIWRATVPGNPQAGYASPLVIDVGGVRQYVNFTSRSVIGVRASDGYVLWEDTGSANGTANCSSPLFFKDHIFSASGYGSGGALLRLTSTRGNTTAHRLYKTPNMKNQHGGMVVIDGYLYGSSDPGILTCLDLRDGGVKWRDRSVGKGSIVCADGNLYLRSEAGPVVLVEVTPAGYREKGRFDQPNRSDRPSWAHPVVAAGKLFLRDQDVLLCYNVQGQ